jgi:hypothetical protein
MTKYICTNIRNITEKMTRGKYGLLADPHAVLLFHDYLSVRRYVYVNYMLINGVSMTKTINIPPRFSMYFIISKYVLKFLHLDIISVRV